MMDSEAKIILAFLFNRSGKTGLTEAELYLPLAMELGWFTTKEAQQFVKYVMKRNLVVKKDGMLSLSFPLETIKIPVGFTPSRKTFNDTSEDKKDEDIIEELMSHIVECTQKQKNEIFREIKKEETEKNILPVAAAVYVARKLGVDVSLWYPVIESVLVKGKTG